MNLSQSYSWPPDLRSEFRWLSSGFLLTFFSGFGQTYFIAIFAGHLKGELGISDGEFGVLYTVGTLSSAALLTVAGRLADLVAIRWLGAGVLGGLALTAFTMASVRSAWMLAPVLFGLRFFGQGMLTHTAMTAMGRWFNRKRGRAVAFAGLGLPASEGLLPPVAVALIGWLGWRGTWLAAGTLLLLAAAPAFVALLRYERHPTAGPPRAQAAANPVPLRQWTRREVLHSGLFYALLPGVLAPAFVLTAIFFNQVTLVELKGWKLGWFAAAFPLLAGTHILSLLLAGWTIDRYGSRRLLPGYLALLGIATLMLALAEAPQLLFVVMTLFGITLGFGAAVSGTLWPELFGVLHLGAIRSVTTAATVVATAVSPGLVGVLLDLGVGLETQLIAMAAYSLIAAAAMLALIPRLDRLAAA